MPEPAFDEKEEIRRKSQLSSQTITLLHPAHVLPDSIATQAPDKGKAILEDNDDAAVGVESRNRASVASSSSSSSSAETEENSLPSSSSSQQHDEAKDTKYELEAQSSSNWRRDLSTSEAPVREEKQFEDLPGQADLGSGMELDIFIELAQLSEGAANPAEMMAVDTIPFFTYVPSFSMALGGGIDSFSDEYILEDPDYVGLENLGIFRIL